MIVIATTLTTFAMLGEREVWASWLDNADAFAASHDVQFFAAIETDRRGIGPFAALTERLEQLDGHWWWYSLDDGRQSVTTLNRQRHLTMGENLAADYATDVGATHMLFVAADCTPPPDVLPRLLEVAYPLVGAECPTYCLHGNAVDGYQFPVQAQPFSAACVLIERQLFKRLRWRYDPDEGMTDDPAYEHDALDLFGVQSYVRKDCVARHYPEAIPAIEHRGYDLKVEQ